MSRNPNQVRMYCLCFQRSVSEGGMKEIEDLSLKLGKYIGADQALGKRDKLKRNKLINSI